MELLLPTPRWRRYRPRTTPPRWSTCTPARTASRNAPAIARSTRRYVTDSGSRRSGHMRRRLSCDTLPQRSRTGRRLPALLPIARLPNVPPVPYHISRPWLSGLGAVAVVAVLLGMAALLFGGRLGLGVGSRGGPPRPSFAGTQGLFADVSMVSPTEGWALAQVTKTPDGKSTHNTVTFYHYQNGIWTPETVTLSAAAAAHCGERHWRLQWGNLDGLGHRWLGHVAATLTAARCSSTTRTAHGRRLKVHPAESGRRTGDIGAFCVGLQRSVQQWQSSSIFHFDGTILDTANDQRLT